MVVLCEACFRCKRPFTWVEALEFTRFWHFVVLASCDSNEMTLDGAIWQTIVNPTMKHGRGRLGEGEFQPQIERYQPDDETRSWQEALIQ